ncbi:MAG: hypothetical protein IJU16_02630, partial [Clostridia bacterium]|nr:hypothetical protein [Clostridia bacterium]
MTVKRWLAVLLACGLLFLCGCDSLANLAQLPTVKSPEVGKWYGKITIDNIENTALSEEEKLVLSLFTGDTLFEVNLEFMDDGTYEYEIDSQVLQDALSKSLTTILSWFV